VLPGAASCPKDSEFVFAYSRRFILFNNKSHLNELRADEIRAFLTDLAVRQKVAASTQNVGFRALLFQSLGTHLLENGYNILTVQEFLVHKEVRTRQIYTYVTQKRTL